MRPVATTRQDRLPQLYLIPFDGIAGRISGHRDAVVDLPPFERHNTSPCFEQAGSRSLLLRTSKIAPMKRGHKTRLAIFRGHSSDPRRLQSHGGNGHVRDGDQIYALPSGFQSGASALSMSYRMSYRVPSPTFISLTVPDATVGLCAGIARPHLGTASIRR